MLKPLTGTDKNGKPYSRPDPVREEIEAILKLPLSDAFRLAAEGKLRPQTLVYLMRNCRPNRPTREHDNLSVTFFSRLERFGDRLIHNFSEIDQEKIKGEVKDIAIELVHKDQLDIFEMSFKTGATRLYLTARAKYRRRANAEISREDLVDPKSDMTGEETADALSFVQDGTLPLAEARAILHQVVEKLTENEKLAIFYVYLPGRRPENLRQSYARAGLPAPCSCRRLWRLPVGHDRPGQYSRRLR